MQIVVDSVSNFTNAQLPTPTSSADQAAVRLSAALAEEFFGICGARSPGPISIRRAILAFMLTSCMYGARGGVPGDMTSATVLWDSCSYVGNGWWPAAHSERSRV